MRTVPTGSSWQPHLSRKGMVGPAALLLGAVLTALILAFLTGPGRAMPSRGPSDAALAAFESQTGVRLVRVSVTSGGGMLDLRYQVLDPDRAVVVHDVDNPPAVIDSASGAEMRIPWMDHSHQKELHAGVTYYTLLMNAGGKIARGNEVSIVLGGVRLDHVVVQ